MASALNSHPPIELVRNILKTEHGDGILDRKVNSSDAAISTRDYDVQQHKAEVYQEFERRIKQAFPEGYSIDTFEFGLEH